MHRFEVAKVGGVRRSPVCAARPWIMLYNVMLCINHVSHSVGENVCLLNSMLCEIQCSFYVCWL